MKDESCVHFLQWALPHLHMRWSGFRRVYSQVCKRLARRVKALQLDNIENYQHYLQSHEQEWQVLDGLCQVTISRFYRDRMMFAFLADKVLPELAQQAIEQNRSSLKVWCIGCGAGEEPYTLSLAWYFQLQQQFPDISLQVVATDASASQLERMAEGCYPYGSIKNLPVNWREQVFVQQDEQYCLQPDFRRRLQQDVQMLQQDIREQVPPEAFDLVLCRNLVFTYYDEDLQRDTLTRLRQQLITGGALVLGIHEQLPPGISGFEAWSERLRIFRQTTCLDD